MAKANYGSGGANYPSEKQLNYAKMISDELGVDIPGEVMGSSRELGNWIDEQSRGMPRDAEGKIVFKASMGQISFAERIAQSAGLQVPEECYRDRRAMSKWIDENGALAGPGRATDKMIATARKIYEKARMEGRGDVPEPAACEDNFQDMKKWLDDYFPPEWRK